MHYVHPQSDLTIGKAVGALEFGMQYLFWRFLSDARQRGAVARQQRGLGGKFSQVHYYSLGWSYLPDFIEIAHRQIHRYIERQKDRQTLTDRYGK